MSAKTTDNKSSPNAETSSHKPSKTLKLQLIQTPEKTNF